MTSENLVSPSLPWDFELLNYWLSAENFRVVLIRRNGRHPFVTYRVAADGDCYWGNYCDDYETAKRDFDERCGIA